MTYAGSSATDYTLTLSGVLTKGSTVTGSAAADSVTGSSTLGTTYNLGAGNDKFTSAVAELVADGTDDTVVNGGDGTDDLTISDAAPTLTDNHFTYVSNMETLTTSTGNTVIGTSSAPLG